MPDRLQAEVGLGHCRSDARVGRHLATALSLCVPPTCPSMPIRFWAMQVPHLLVSYPTSCWAQWSLESGAAHRTASSTGAMSPQRVHAQQDNAHAASRPTVQHLQCSTASTDSLLCTGSGSADLARLMKLVHVRDVLGCTSRPTRQTRQPLSSMASTFTTSDLTSATQRTRHSIRTSSHPQTALLWTGMLQECFEPLQPTSLGACLAMAGFLEAEAQRECCGRRRATPAAGLLLPKLLRMHGRVE